MELYLLETVTLLAKGNESAALVALDSALAIAAPRGIMHLFVDMGEPIATLLTQRSLTGPLGAFAAHLLAAFGHDVANAAPLAPARVFDDEEDALALLPMRPRGSIPNGAALVEPLSEREHEVLQLMARGMSNQEIADRLQRAYREKARQQHFW